MHTRNRFHYWVAVFAGMAVMRAISLQGQSSDWKNVVWREPQVRYLLADLTFGGNAGMYRKYAAEGDPDSREAIRLWDAGARVINTNEFERKWIANSHGKDGKVMRIVQRGTERTITGNEVLLTEDLKFQQAPMRLILAELTLGVPLETFTSRKSNPTLTEALRRWREGVRVANSNWFELRKGNPAQVVYRGTQTPVDGTVVQLNSDVPYPETNARYFMADIALGGSIEFYRHAAEKDHEMGCLEAVRRTEDGFRITNLDQFERKRVNGQTLITRKGSNERISGMEVRLSSDPQP